MRPIPAGEVLDDANLPAEPPASLIEALRFFFVGLAATLAANDAPKRRSMMVHPSRIRQVHRTLQHWVEDCIATWRQIEALDPADPDRQDFERDFRAAWDDVRKTAPDIADFDAVMAKMRRALRRTQVIEFNTNGRVRTPEIEWRDADGWILIGGQALDRGYTVDSLTVTYMPRGVGTGNADAVQQRARFFGYKRGYLGLCRVYLESSTLTAFRNYVAHEEIMRGELEKVAASDTSLREWVRQFVLSSRLERNMFGFEATEVGRSSARPNLPTTCAPPIPRPSIGYWRAFSSNGMLATRPRVTLSGTRSRVEFRCRRWPSSWPSITCQTLGIPRQ